MNNSMNKSTVFVVHTVGYKAEIFLYIALTIKCAANFLLVFVCEVFIQLNIQYIHCELLYNLLKGDPLSIYIECLLCYLQTNLMRTREDIYI